MEAYSYMLTLSVLMFLVGLTGVIIRRNTLVVLMCIELILNSANLSFATFSALHAELSGQVMVLFSMVLAAAEAAVGLAIIICLFKFTKSVESTQAAQLKG